MGSPNKFLKGSLTGFFDDLSFEEASGAAEDEVVAVEDEDVLELDFSCDDDVDFDLLLLDE